MNRGKFLEILKPLSRYCHDNEMPQLVCEIDIVRGDKIWICCRSGHYEGIAIGDTCEETLLKAIEKFIANCPCPYQE